MTLPAAAATTERTACGRSAASSSGWRGELLRTVRHHSDAAHRMTRWAGTWRGEMAPQRGRDGDELQEVGHWEASVSGCAHHTVV